MNTLLPIAYDCSLLIRIISEQVCEVETQTVVLEQFQSGIEQFSKTVVRKSEKQVGFDSNIAGLLGKIVNSDGSLSTGDLGFTGSDVGNSTVVPTGNNWNSSTSPASTGKVKDAAKQAAKASNKNNSSNSTSSSYGSSSSSSSSSSVSTSTTSAGNATSTSAWTKSGGPRTFSFIFSDFVDYGTVGIPRAPSKGLLMLDISRSMVDYLVNIRS